MFVAVYTVLMLIYPNGQHYQFVGFPLFYSLNFNITLSLQFPPAATGPDLSRSYQHNSLMTLKPFRWRKHQHSHVHTWTPSIYPLSIRTPTHIFYKNTYRHTYLVSVIETLSLSFFFQPLYHLGLHFPHTRKRKPILRRKLPPYYLLAKALVNVSYT